MAYLTHSAYGRNGNEVTINNSSTFITGNAGESVSAGEATGITNAYNTTKGMLASTTGNITGIYDMSGGAYEYVAAFNKNASSTALSDGNIFATAGGNSTKYATAYNGDTKTTPSSSRCIVGDATYEVFVNSGSLSKAWFSDNSNCVNSVAAFFMRGGCYNEGTLAGIFSSNTGNGTSIVEGSFRVCLPGGEGIVPNITEIGLPSKNYIKKGESVTYSITTNEPVTIADVTKVTLTGVGRTGSTVSITGSETKWTATVTGGTGNGAVTLNLEAGLFQDAAGKLNDSTSIKTGLIIDNAPPTMTVSPASGAVAKTRNVMVTISDSGSGVSNNNNLTYYLSTSSTNPTENGYQTGTYKSGTAFTLGTGLTGTYYLFLPVVADNVGNTSVESITGYYRCGTYKFDNTAPNITSFTTSATSICDSFTVTTNAADIGPAGLAPTNTYTYYFSDNGGTSYTSSTSTDTRKSYTGLTGASGTQYKAYVVVKDAVGNSKTSSTLTMTVHNTLTKPSVSGGTYNNTKKINSPYVYSGLNPVMWDGTTEIHKYCKHWQTTSEWTNNNGDSNWYNYTTGTGDHKTSKWANVIDENGSYYVWIPRYAYKITSTTADSTKAGTIDVKFINGKGSSAVDGTSCKIATSNISTTTQYVVHPAFCTNVNMGGFGQELSGIWVAKYEACNVSNKPVSKPDTSSWRNITIGDCYTTAYNYNRNMDSHLMKNSEWRSSGIFNT